MPALKKDIADLKIWARVPKLISRANPDGSLAVIDFSRPKSYFVLTQHSITVFKLLDGKTTVSSLIKKLEKRTKLAPAEVRKGVINTLSKLKRHGLIRLAAPRK